MLEAQCKDWQSSATAEPYCDWFMSKMSQTSCQVKREVNSPCHEYRAALAGCLRSADKVAQQTCMPCRQQAQACSVLVLGVLHTLGSLSGKVSVSLSRVCKLLSARAGNTDGSLRWICRQTCKCTLSLEYVVVHLFGILGTVQTCACVIRDYNDMHERRGDRAEPGHISASLTGSH